MTEDIHVTQLCRHVVKCGAEDFWRKDASSRRTAESCSEEWLDDSQQIASSKVALRYRCIAPDWEESIVVKNRRQAGVGPLAYCWYDSHLHRNGIHVIIGTDQVNVGPEKLDDSISMGDVDPPVGRGRLKLIALVLLVAAAGVGYLRFGDLLSLDYLAGQEVALRQYRTERPWLAVVIATLIYIAVAGLSIPGATALTLSYGWYFGFWQGLVIVSIGSTGGATVAFLLTRYFFRDMVQRKFSSRLQSVQDAMRREGAFYLFSLRLMPAIPFFVINALMGLTGIGVVSFWWVSQIGMLPATVAYVYAGSQFPSLQKMASDGVGLVLSWQLLLAFAIIGILPLLFKWSLGRLQAYRRHRNGSEAIEHGL